MSDLSALVQEGFGQAITAVLPLLGAALVGSVVAGWLAARVGLSDPVAAAVLRGLAVLVALWLVVEGLSLRAHALTTDTWAQLADVGRGEP